VEDVSIMCQ